MSIASYFLSSKNRRIYVTYIYKHPPAFSNSYHDSFIWLLHTSRFPLQHLNPIDQLGLPTYLRCEYIKGFSYNGLISFCQEGRLFGYPDEFYRPFNSEERKTVLNRMLQLNQDGKQLFLLTDHEAFRPCEKLTVFSNGTEAVFAFTNEQDYRICCILETSITLAIKEFMENAVRLHLLNTVQDTNMAIQDAMAKIPTD